MNQSTTSARRLIRPFMVIVVVGVVATACAVAPSSGGVAAHSSSPGSVSAALRSGSVAAQVQLDPVQAPQPLADHCNDYGTMVERAATTIEMDTLASDAVVVGRVSDVGAAQWNTPDSLPPTRPDIDATRVMRLIRVEVESTVVGQAIPVLTLWIPGGTIGCNSFGISGIPQEFKDGERYAFFVGSAGPRTGLDSVLEVREMWPIENEAIISPVEGRIPLATFLERASAVAATD